MKKKKEKTLSSIENEKILLIIKKKIKYFPITKRILAIQ